MSNAKHKHTQKILLILVKLTVRTLFPKPFWKFGHFRETRHCHRTNRAY